MRRRGILPGGRFGIREEWQVLRSGRRARQDHRATLPILAGSRDDVFGILVSPCKVCVEFPNARVLVVKDHELGTNDCRGWIRRSLFEQLHLPDRRFYQFRLSFDNTQAKGSFKVMEDDAADALSAEIVIPRSSCKPEYRKSEVSYQCPANGGRVTGQYSTGRVVVGIREVSRNLQFSSSYTLIEHAPIKSIETEIKPIAMAAVEAVKNAIANNDFGELFEILGISDEVELFRPDESIADSEHTSTEHTVVEAVLKADSTGYWMKHPFVNSHLQRIMARWAFKLCTAGGFTLPAFALADDGYLVLHNGNILCGSDWIPEWKAITSLDSRRMLVVRYPIRTKADLLPVEALNNSEILERLMWRLGRQNGSVDAGTAAGIVDKHSGWKGRSPFTPKQLRKMVGTTTSTGFVWWRASGSHRS